MSFKFILFAAIIILVYFLTCFYIGYNGWVWLKSTTLKGKGKKIYIGFFVMLAMSIFIEFGTSWSFFQWMSGYWMGVIGYSIILFPIANLLYYLLKKRGIFWIGSGVLAIITFIFILGSYNAWNPIIRNYDISLSNQTESSSVKIMMASDLHLGEIVGTTHLQKLVEIAKEEKPDMILFAGDIIDDHIEPFIEKNMLEIFINLQAPLGIYAVSGNHDVYGEDLEELQQELERIGIHFLRDEATLINNQFYLIGRKDLAEDHRKGSDSLTEGLDETKPIIMLDHQPTELDQTENAGVDLLLSGHTHNGQLAPANLFTEKLFENDWGYLKKDRLHSIVSSGYGTWGPPLRIGSRSEVLMINLNY
ncbi:metallophosphoesterase [Niallia sp. Krafla_26]|uniref:metallophosphoesterase n=1 Tax=Niallia sp. Krafla_26 TaxID=3064703 RepID=UPI003D17F624